MPGPNTAETTAAPKWAKKAVPDIWMTGDPRSEHTNCVAFCPADPVWTDQGWCEGVMVEVHFGLDLEIRICRRHLDLFADMIVHTRQLREANLLEATPKELVQALELHLNEFGEREIARAGPEAAT